MGVHTLTCFLQMYEYYEKYTQASGDADAQERWARQLIWEVARHAVGEVRCFPIFIFLELTPSQELVVYPLMEQHMGEKGLKLADQDRADHQVRSSYSPLVDP